MKPHAGPVFHAFQDLCGTLDLPRMQNFRGLNGVQSCPLRTKDLDDVGFSTGSAGPGVTFTAYGSMLRDCVRAKGWDGVSGGGAGQ